MGKAGRWLRLLLGSKKSQSSSSESSPAARDKGKTTSNSRWGLAKSSNTNDRLAWSCEDPSSSSYIETLDANKHAIAVAAATAAVAEAALAAAQAAAEVVRLTNGGKPVAATRTVSTAYAGGGGSSRECRQELAAIKIQSAFRAYLARRALRALRGLVKLQALVRGRIVRKQSADMLRRMQAMARIQSRACASRAHISGTPHSHLKFSRFHHSRGGSKSSFNESINMENLPLDSSWLDRWMEESTLSQHRETSFRNLCLEDEKSDKILEIDTWKPHYKPRRRDKTFQAPQYFSSWKDHVQETPVFDPMSGLSNKLEKPNSSVSSGDVTSLASLKFPLQADQAVAWTAENSPCAHSASSRFGSSNRKGPFTPTRSEYSRSLFGDYVNHPNYMANTESSRAKVRSQSAPRQRMQSERIGSCRNFGHVLWDAESISEKGSIVQSNFSGKAHPGSGRVNRLETPMKDDAVGFRMSYRCSR